MINNSTKNKKLKKNLASMRSTKKRKIKKNELNKRAWVNLKIKIPTLFFNY